MRKNQKDDFDDFDFGNEAEETARRADQAEDSTESREQGRPENQTGRKRSGKQNQTGRSRASQKAGGGKERIHFENDRDRGVGEMSRMQAAMPYILLALGAFLIVCLTLNLICNFGNKLAGNPSAHWMGYFGYGIAYALHGLFGFPAMLMPALMIVLFFFWKRYYTSRRLVLKVLNMTLFLFLISIFVHTCYLASLHEIKDFAPSTLLEMGAELTGGGFFGGKLAYYALKTMNWAGAFIVEILLLIISFFYMIGVTPRYIYMRIRHRKELSGRTRTLSEQEAEKAKRQAQKVAEEKRAQTGNVETTPEGYPAGSVTVYDRAGKPMKESEMDLPPMPNLNRTTEDRLYLPPDIRKALREEDERRKAELEQQRMAREQAAPGTRPARAVPAPLPPQTPTPPTEEVRASYETVDPIFPQSDNKNAKRVQKEDRNFDLKDIFQEGSRQTGAKAEQAHAPLPPERPVTNRTAGRKPPEPAKTPAPAAEKKEPPKESVKTYVFPPLDLLKRGEPMSDDNRSEIEKNMKQLAETLDSFRVGVSGIDYSCGPTVTRYEIMPAPGVHARSIINLSSDIALNFAVKHVRMEQIEGKSAIGVEVPNKTRYTVYLRNLLESQKFQNGKGKLTVALGADVVNQPVVFDIADMPHLLIGGATKMGKSVCINGLIMSLLYRTKPDEVKLVLVDPKKVEFTPYRSLPHLLAPIITSANDAAGALQAAVNEMEHRYDLIQEVGAKKLESYNEITKNDPDKPFLPYLVIIIDELADLMLQARDQVEEPICRLLQKGRACGIHLILGTQRPSVDVVTGLIKSNLPSRIACTVVSQVDSRTILDASGAEKLLGQGDMLFSPVGSNRPERVQGAFVSDHEVESVCNFIRAKNGNAVYDENFTEKMKEFSAQIVGKNSKADDVVVSDDAKEDPKYVEAIRVGIEEGRMSTSLLQRRLEIGYGRAAKLIDRMQAEGIVSPPDGSKPRSILISNDEFLERFVDNEFDSGDSEE